MNSLTNDRQYDLLVTPMWREWCHFLFVISLGSECRLSTTQPGKSELSCESNICLVQPDVISGINSNARLGWHAANYSTFWGRKLDEGLVLRLGTLEPERFVNEPYIIHWLATLVLLIKHDIPFMLITFLIALVFILLLPGMSYESVRGD